MSKRLHLIWSDPNDRHLLIAVLTQVLIAACLFWVNANAEDRLRLSQLGIQAQSIQHGAELYLTYCTACHGIDGLGQAGQAPALNNPQLFGHDFFPEVNHQIDDLYNETRTLTDENNANGTTDSRRAEIKARLDLITKTIADLNSKRTSDVKAAVDKGYDPNDVKYDRLRQVGWEGTTQSFILTTLIHGRPVSTNYWPQAMPAYSEEAFSGVTLERYQLDDLTAYILNWDKGNHWTFDDLYAVNQFAILPRDPRPSCCVDPILNPLLNVTPVGKNLLSITKELKLKNTIGDPERGDKLYHAKVYATLTNTNLPCTGCHQQTADGVGPMTNGTYTRVINERLKQPQFAGYTAEEYLIDSIVNPANYIVPGFKDLMVRNLGTDILDAQDLADLVAYLKTQK